ncbi:hypothetical protein [Niveibacterium microcysteis]|uniref:Uncharacterized protein n=1 Tax=Niveibacterium microcysteis TaxID=2811415 RepID=A0ABX7M9B4_9RHOO|nr:hypothetical protein [Niveibacterium microcysteis]QSI78191.1 hypothetical protein JY500_06015 [Niveibacterium microcysteis]
MFARVALFGRRNETLVRSCQPAMYAASTGFTRAAEVRFNALERRATVVAKPVVFMPAAKAVSARRESIAKYGTVADLSNFQQYEDEFESSFYAHLGGRVDPDVTNLLGSCFLD